jgi:hypothetical protein
VIYLVAALFVVETAQHSGPLVVAARTRLSRRRV